MQRCIRQIAIRPAGNVPTGEVKVIGAAGNEGELLCETKLCRQPGYLRRNVIARCIELSIAATPHKVAAGIYVWPGQTVVAGRGEALTVFYDDLNILRAAAQFAAAKVKGNGFQPVRAQRVRVQDFKDRAESVFIESKRNIAVTPVAARSVPTVRTIRRRVDRSILSPRSLLTTVFDISVILVQYPVPFVALGRAAFGIARACTFTSHRRRTQRIVHAIGSVVSAENQASIVQGIPTYRILYGIISHEQAVEIFVLLCILLCGRHL